MRAVLLDVSQSFLEQRRRVGHDVWDEVWEGELHMVPPPSSGHQRFASRLMVTLLPIAEAHGLVAMHEAGLYRPEAGEADYRVPDLVVARPENVSHRGVEGRAELVVEIRSPGDESYEKLDFYAAVAVQEVLIAAPGTCSIELFVLRGGRLHAALPDPSGSVTSASLGVSFTTVDGPALRLRGPEGTVDIAAPM